MKSIQKKTASLLSLLLLLFVFRVSAQLIQSYQTIKWLPPFHAWHSQTIPYPYLLVAQLTIIIFFSTMIKCFYQEKVTPKIMTGKIYLLLGSLYFSFMILRLILGQFIFKNHLFWSSTLPTLFHLILALFLIIIGLYHLIQKTKK